MVGVVSLCSHAYRVLLLLSSPPPPPQSRLSTAPIPVVCHIQPKDHFGRLDAFVGLYAVLFFFLGWLWFPHGWRLEGNITQNKKTHPSSQSVVLVLLVSHNK